MEHMPQALAYVHTTRMHATDAQAHATDAHAHAHARATRAYAQAHAHAHAHAQTNVHAFMFERYSSLRARTAFHSTPSGRRREQLKSRGRPGETGTLLAPPHKPRGRWP